MMYICILFCRYYVIHRLPQLNFLDSRPVTSAERTEAKRVGAFMQVVRPNEDMVGVVDWSTLFC